MNQVDRKVLNYLKRAKLIVIEESDVCHSGSDEQYRLRELTIVEIAKMIQLEEQVQLKKGHL